MGHGGKLIECSKESCIGNEQGVREGIVRCNRLKGFSMPERCTRRREIEKSNHAQCEGLRWHGFLCIREEVAAQHEHRAERRMQVLCRHGGEQRLDGSIHYTLWEASLYQAEIRRRLLKRGANQPDVVLPRGWIRREKAQAC